MADNEAYKILHMKNGKIRCVKAGLSENEVSQFIFSKNFDLMFQGKGKMRLKDERTLVMKVGSEYETWFAVKDCYITQELKNEIENVDEHVACKFHSSQDNEFVKVNGPVLTAPAALTSKHMETKIRG